MKRSLRISPWRVLLNLIIVLLFFADISLAAKAAESGGSDWRGTYDYVMRWLNTLIFFGAVYKYGKDPIKSFIDQQREVISGGIGSLEKEKEEMEAQVSRILKMGEDSQKQFEKLKHHILSEGDRRKTAIIETATIQSAMVIKDAKRKVEHRILSAKMNFREKLIDAATEIALQKLPSAVTSEDQEKRMEQFFGVIGAS